MATTEQTISLDGLKVHFLEDGQGQGRTLLLIHSGIGDAKLHWLPALSILAEQYHVLAPDLPGYGGSDPLPQRRTDVLLHWIKSFLDYQEVEQAVCVGNSLGGLFARLFAAANPRYVPAVILVNGGSVPDLPGALRAAERIPLVSNFIFSRLGNVATSPETLRQQIHASGVLSESFLQEVRSYAPAFAATMRMLVGSPLPQTQTPLVPTLILWGTEDRFTPLTEAEAIKASIPGSVLTEIAECGHMPQLEAPDVFAWQITTFLERLHRPPSPPRSSPKTLRNHPG